MNVYEKLNEEKMSIGRKLQKSRLELRNMNLKKGAKNPYANFKYYELADFLPQAIEILYNNGLYSVFNIDGEAFIETYKKFNKESKSIEDEPGLGLRGTATLTIYDMDDEGKQIKFTMPVVGSNVKGCSPMQSLGSVRTYVERYLYMNALDIVESDALEANVGKPVNDYEKEIEKIASVEELNSIYSSCKSKIASKADWLNAKYNKDTCRFESHGNNSTVDCSQPAV